MTDEHQSLQDQPPGIPRWVKISGIVVGIFILVLVITMLAGGNHGSDRHKPSAAAHAGQTLTVGSSLGSPRW